MRVPFPLIGGIQFLAALTWASVLVFTTGLLEPSPALLYACCLLLLATVALAGLAINHGRWALLLSFGVIGMEALAALLVAATPPWWIAISATALALVATAGPWMDPYVRQLSPPTPLPPESMALMLGLLAYPAILALTNTVDVWSWILAIASVVIAWAYGRALLAGLWSARLALIPLAVPVMLAGGWLRAGVVLGSSGALTYLAWTAGARSAVIPLDPRQVSTHPVFPEMTPTEVLDAAGYDERGRPRL